MIQPVKLQRYHVQLGKPLPWNVYGSNARLLLNRGYIIESEQQLEALLERGMYIEASELEQAIADKPLAVKNYDAFRFWDDMSAKLGVTLARPSIEQDFPTHLAAIASQVQYIAQRSADTVIAIIMMTMDHRRYPIVHSLQVAVFCEMVANRLGWEKTRRMDLLCAALSMNMGMLEAQQQLATQSVPLSSEQQQFIKRHPMESAAMLRNAGVTSPGWLKAVEEHHETASGTGYPRGIKELSDEAALLRTLDVFCAKISPRLHRKPMSGTQAARVLFSEKGMASDNPFIPSLIKEIGVHPPGSFVKLINSETAIVHKRGSGTNTPHVLSLINPKGVPLAEPIRRDTSNELFKIKSEVPREQILISVNPERIWVESPIHRYG